MAAEIAEQPEVFQRILDDRDGELTELVRWSRALDLTSVMFVARGTSDHAALYGSYLVQIILGIPAGLASASVVSLYGAAPFSPGTLVVGVSQSGQSPDLIAVCEAARASGAPTVAITNDSDSPLALLVDRHVNIQAGPEQAVAATKSYGAQLLTLLAWITAWNGQSLEPLSELPGLAAATLAMSVAESALELLVGATRVVVTGRGLAYPTALEAALKLVETTGVDAHAFSAADLLHGPIALVDPGTPTIVIGSRTEDPTSAEIARTIGILEERDARILMVGIDPEMPFPYAVPGLRAAAPILQILPLQRACLSASRRRGHDPDQPSGLSKVTLTL
jgi:glucosamine--fructose-6-phosphate aminotransferase (isomerizing)